jgi:hypothetical protein
MDERDGGLAAALDQIRGVDIDEAAVRDHVMRPDHLLAVSSHQGREDVPVQHAYQPPRPVFYAFDGPGFIQELERLLTGNVAGYSIRLTENGATTIGLADQNWAKWPQDGSQAWTPDTRMHVASLSKIVTAIAMTRLLGETGISTGTPIIEYLPRYW